MKNNIVKEKSFAFAVRIVKLSRHLIERKKEFVLSKQILRSGTSIGALVRSPNRLSRTCGIVHKLSIALKEANETEYWLLLLKKTDYLTAKEFSSILNDLKELLKLLTSIIKTAKRNK